MSWDMNVQANPEKWELTIIGQLDDPEACYSFDDLVVWQHADGRVFYASDSGCSCPSPFEDFTSLADLTLVTADTWAEFQSAVEEHAVPWRWRERTPDDVDPQAADKTQLLAKVSALVPRGAA